MVRVISKCLKWRINYFLFPDISHVWRGRSQNSLHVWQRDELQPEIPSLRLELQRGLCLLPRLVGHKTQSYADQQIIFILSIEGIIWMTWPTEQILPRAQQSLTTWGGGKVGGVSRNPRSRRRRRRPRSRRRRPSLILLTSDIERNICETRNVLISEQLRAYSSSQRSVSKQWLVIKLNLNIYLFIHLCIRIIRLVLTTAKCGHFVNSFCYLYVKLCHFYSFIAQFF